MAPLRRQTYSDRRCVNPWWNGERFGLNGCVGSWMKTDTDRGAAQRGMHGNHEVGAEVETDEQSETIAEVGVEANQGAVNRRRDETEAAAETAPAVALEAAVVVKVEAATSTKKVAAVHQLRPSASGRTTHLTIEARVRPGKLILSTNLSPKDGCRALVASTSLESSLPTKVIGSSSVYGTHTWWLKKLLGAPTPFIHNGVHI